MSDSSNPFRLAWATYVEDVRQAARIEDVVKKEAGPHAKKVRNALVFSAPTRKERTPSFYVYPDQGRYFDFGTKDSGDVFGLVQQLSGCSFREAVDQLAATYGVTFHRPDGEDSELDAYLAEIVERRKVRAMATACALWMHKDLPTEARAHLKERYGFSDETIDKFQIGWCSPSSYAELSEIHDEDLLCKTGYFYRQTSGVSPVLTGRIVFPYWARGEVVYAIGRLWPEPLAADGTVDQGELKKLGKYKKILHGLSEEHPEGTDYVAPFVQNDHFYNEDAATRGLPKYVVITEGVTDCISLAEAGVPCISPVGIQPRAADYDKLVKNLERIPKTFIVNDNDTLESGEKPGLKGALKTATELFKRGIRVQIAVPPAPPGQRKVDVNDFLRAMAPEDRKSKFLELLETAKDLPDVLLQSVPRGKPGPDIAKKLEDWIDIVGSITDAIVRDVYVSTAAAWTQVKKSSLSALLRPLAKAAAVEKKAEEREKKKAEVKKEVFLGRQEDRIRGKIEEEVDHYFVTHELADEVISTFTLTAKRVVSDGKGSEVVVCDIRLRNGQVIPDYPFPKSAWVGKKSFIASFPSCKMSWTGSDDNVQGLLSRLTNGLQETALSTNVLGYHQVGPEPGDRRYVLPHMTLTPEGPQKNPDIMFIGASSLADRLMKVEPLQGEKLTLVLRRAMALLPAANKPEVSVPIFSFIFASPWKTRLKGKLGHFPILNVAGTHGAGKSTILGLAWSLMGIPVKLDGKQTSPFSVGETKFVMAKTLSSTNAIPVYFDEYKHDVPQKIRLEFGRFLRRAYSGEQEERGRADQDTNKFDLIAPIIVAGETEVGGDDPALLERVIPVNPEKTSVAVGTSYSAVYGALELIQEDFPALGYAYAQWTLTADMEPILAQAREVVGRALHKAAPPRVIDNLVVLAFGQLAVETWAGELGVDMPDVKLVEVVASIAKEILGDGGEHVPDAFDLFFTELCTMAQMGIIEPGIHYLLEDEMLYLCLRPCIAAFDRWRVAMGKEGDVLGTRSIRKILKEKAIQHDSYIVKVDARAEMRGRKPQAIQIDTKRMSEALRASSEVFLKGDHLPKGDSRTAATMSAVLDQLLEMQVKAMGNGGGGNKMENLGGRFLP